MIRELPEVDPHKLRARVNETAKSILHPDPRDAGEHAELLGAAQVIAAGHEVVTGGEDGPLLQLCHVFSHGCTQYEALSAVGLREDQLSFTLACPHVPEGEGVRVACYAIDYSGTWHGNGRIGTTPLPPHAWVIRVTAYATTHGATWAKRISKMDPVQACRFLRSCMGMPGSAWLGTMAHAGQTHSEAVGETPETSGLTLGPGVAVGSYVRVVGMQTREAKGGLPTEGWLHCTNTGHWWLAEPGGKGERWLDTGTVEIAPAPKRSRGQ